MIAHSVRGIIDFLQAQICYQLFITPILFPLEREYREFARRACDFLQKERTETLHFDMPRHHVVHHFAQQRSKGAKRILIAHGWMSRAAYMARLIRALHKEGFDVFALDFPAHGEAKGMQLPWIDAVDVLHQVFNHLGPFYAVIGHSFGGSMLLNTLNLASQYTRWNIQREPEHVVLLASPTRMNTPVIRLARQFRLTAKGYLLLRQVFRQKAVVDLKRLDFRYYIPHAQIPFLCVHGENDTVIKPCESIVFCEHYQHASLSLLPNMDHVSILLDNRVEEVVCDFLLK